MGEDLLSMCKRNVILNKHMTEPAGEMFFLRRYLQFLLIPSSLLLYTDDLGACVVVPPVLSNREDYSPG